MKTTLKIVLVFVMVAFCSHVSAQKALKLAHINMQELITAMPEHDSAMVKMQKTQKGLEKEMELLNVERNKKYEDYITNNKNMTDLVRQSREQELQAMNQKIQQFTEQAQQSLEEENNKLLQPIIEKANKAIEAVAKEQGITYVLNSQSVAYKALDSQDLLPLVKTNLGIKK